MRDGKLNIGIIGCGTISDIHAQAIRETLNLNLISAFSRNADNLKRITGKYDVKGFTDIDKFIEDPHLDIVSICTPNGTHLDYAKIAAEAGRHVIIEKPIEVDLARAQEVINVCRENGVCLAVIYQNRFIDDVIKMKKAIDSGQIGKIFMADAYIKWFRTQEYYESADWRGTFKMDGGGALINQAVHTVDLLIWMAGNVKSVCAATGVFTHKNIEGEDAAAMLKFENSAIGVLEASTSIIPAFKRKIEIHGDKGTAILEGDKFKLMKDDEVRGAGEDDSSGNAGGSSPLAGFSIQPHQRQFEQISSAILHDKETVVSGEESLKSLALVKAVYESSQTNQFVEVQNLLNKREEK